MVVMLKLVDAIQFQALSTPRRIARRTIVRPQVLKVSTIMVTPVIGLALVLGTNTTPDQVICAARQQAIASFGEEHHSGSDYSSSRQTSLPASFLAWTE